MSNQLPQELQENTDKLDGLNALIELLPDNQKSKVSDGYHTFKELYDHRVTLFIALCNTFSILDEFTEGPYIWKSKLHADGTMWDNWYIAGIGQKLGDTITYHLPIDTWDSLKAYERENAPEWDGHTSEDVLRLLKEI